MAFVHALHTIPSKDPFLNPRSAPVASVCLYYIAVEMSSIARANLKALIAKVAQTEW